ncbi:MAG: FAD-binding oxidoreductase [Deferribacterota bacterium]|nr:FAD-binding oxidoreductase [Deferribacterota bacterium]
MLNKKNTWKNIKPEKNTYRSIFKWGDPETFKNPKPGLLKHIKKTLGINDKEISVVKNSGNMNVVAKKPVRLAEEHINAFRNIVGSENINLDDYSRVKYSTGKTLIEQLNLRKGIIEAVSDIIIHPRSKEDIQKIVYYCNEYKIPIYVYGGGSSVTLGVTPVKGGVTLVMNTHMNKIIELNEKNQTCRVQAGIMGPDYEYQLNNANIIFRTSKKYTCGHFPQSFEYSTVGGWIVTLGAGQQSSYYGDIYDIVISQEYITPVGTFKTEEYPASATGPKINDIMKGSEGAFGILVSATLKIFRYMPENYQNFAFIFPSWELSIEAAREISQGQFGFPSVFRISDPEETDLAFKQYGLEGTIIDRYIKKKGYMPGERCLYIGRAEGEKRFAKNIKKNTKIICKRFNGMYITGFPVKKWESGRYSDPYMREPLVDHGIVVDTLETSVTWDNLHKVYKSVRSFIKSKPHTICTTHASHFYPEGTNLYFIFMTKLEDVNNFKAFHKGIVDTIVESGGSISHHHGIGKMFAPWVEKYFGKEQLEILTTLKKHFDPNNIMNPGGTLGLN